MMLVVIMFYEQKYKKE